MTMAMGDMAVRGRRDWIRRQVVVVDCKRDSDSPEAEVPVERARGQRNGGTGRLKLRGSSFPRFGDRRARIPLPLGSVDPRRLRPENQKTEYR